MNLSQNPELAGLIEAAKDTRMEPPIIDLNLHEYVADEKDLSVSVNVCLDNWAQERSYLDPNLKNSIHLSIQDFKQATCFRYQMYDKNEPEMVLLDDCQVCFTKVVPASCVTDKTG